MTRWLFSSVWRFRKILNPLKFRRAAGGSAIGVGLLRACVKECRGINTVVNIKLTGGVGVSLTPYLVGDFNIFLQQFFFLLSIYNK